MSVELIHITSLCSALSIISSRAYLTENPIGNYDAGMNFLGKLGEYKNTRPSVRGVKMHCEWNGNISEPLPYDAYNCDTANKLFDFNGSGKYFKNNDPRYFLPYNSEGLVVKRIELEKKYDEELLIKDWCYYKGGFTLFFYKLKIFKAILLKRTLDYIQKVNCKLNSDTFTISIRRIHPI